MTGPVVERTISDDGWVHVPLDFVFPFQNGFYNDAFMFSNGVVGFINPNTLTTFGLCCNGQNMLDPTNVSNRLYNRVSTRPALNLAIFGLHTDLVNRTGRFYTQGDESGMRFFWENISEFGRNNNLNTFDIGIYPSGNIDIHHEKINVEVHDVTVGISGNFTTDTANYTHYFYNRRTNGGVFWNGIGENPVVVPQGGTLCQSSPISATSCPGYAEAFAEAEFNNSCRSNPQFDQSGPGFQAPVNTSTSAGTVATAGVDSTVADIIATPVALPVAVVAPQPVEVVVETVVEPVVVVNTTQQTSTTEAPAQEQSTPAENVINEVEAELAIALETDTESSESVEPPAENTTDSEDTTNTTEVATESIEDNKSTKKKMTKAESKREKMKAIIKNKLNNLATDMANAKTMELQQAVQAQINALINYVPGFNAYGQFSIPGVTFYTPEPLYVNKRIPENNRGLLNGLASQILHEKMIDMQYNR